MAATLLDDFPARAAAVRRCSKLAKGISRWSRFYQTIFSASGVYPTPNTVRNSQYFKTNSRDLLAVQPQEEIQLRERFLSERIKLIKSNFLHSVFFKKSLYGSHQTFMPLSVYQELRPFCKCNYEHFRKTLLRANLEAMNKLFRFITDVEELILSMNARKIVGRFDPDFVMMSYWNILCKVDQPYTTVFAPEILQAVARHAGDPVGILHQEYYSKVTEHTTILTDGSKRSLNLWTCMLLDVSCFYLQKHAEAQNVPAARFGFMNWN